MTAGEAAQGGCGSRKPTFTHRQWLSTHCTPSMGLGPCRCMGTACVGGALMSFLHQETRKQHQGASGSPGSQAHVTHSRSSDLPPCLPGKRCAQRGKVAATRQGEWATVGLQKPMCPKARFCPSPFMSGLHPGIHFSPVLSLCTRRPQNRAQRAAASKFREQPQRLRGRGPGDP